MTSLHTDIPTRAQVDRLLTARDPASVTLYLPTDPTSRGDAERIELKNQTGVAVEQLRQAGAGREEVVAVEDHLAALSDDAPFWRYQARCLAVFVTPERLVTFRLPNHLGAMAAVADRFHVKPLLRAITFPQAGFVLTLAQGGVGLWEFLPGLTLTEVDVPDLPADVASAVGRASIAGRSPIRRIQGSEGQKVRMHQYARQVDRALRPVLPGGGVPLILAGVEPLTGIFRSVCGYEDLAPDTLPGPSGDGPGDELAVAARDALDAVHADRLRTARERFEQAVSAGRTATDVAEVARRVTEGAVQVLFADIDNTVAGTVDDAGAVRFGEDGGDTYGVVDEITRRAWLSGAQVLAVRGPDVPGGGDVAALLRYHPGHP